MYHKSCTKLAHASLIVMKIVSLMCQSYTPRLPGIQASSYDFYVDPWMPTCQDHQNIDFDRNTCCVFHSDCRWEMDNGPS